MSVLDLTKSKFRAHGLRLSIILCMLSVLISCSSHETKVIKLAHALDTQHPVHEAMVYFAKLVEEKSDEKLKVEIYPSQQLGTESQCLELVQIGIVDITKVSAAVMEGIVPEFKIFSFPYLFKNKQHYFNTLDGEVGEEMLLKGEDYWLHGLCYYDAGSRSFYGTKKMIETPSDLTGMKIRVMQSNTAIQMIKALGGSATPISWGELYTALQSGIVDAAENNPPSFYLSRHYEVCKYYSVDEHASIPDVLVMSTHLWDNLSEKERQIIKEASIESSHYQRELWAKSEAHAMSELEKEGVEILYPDKEPFMQKVESMYKNYKDDKAIYPLIQRIRSVEE